MRSMIARFMLFVLVAVQLAPAQAPVQPRIERIEKGLLPSVQVKGAAGWSLPERMKFCGAGLLTANTGDGAGLLIQMPHAFLVRECAALGFNLPGPRYYGVGMIFLPTDDDLRRDFERRLEEIVAAEGQHVLGWRTVPTDGRRLGPTAASAQPVIRQVFIEHRGVLQIAGMSGIRDDPQFGAGYLIVH